MTDPPHQRPPSQPPGEMRSAPPPLPGVPASVPARSVFLPLLGMIPGAIALVLLVIHLISSSVQQGEIDFPGDVGPTASQERLPPLHPENMYLFAEDLAKQNYRMQIVEGGRVPATSRDMDFATRGKGYGGLRPPDSGPYILEWRLNRGYQESDLPVSFNLDKRLPIFSHLSIKRADGEVSDAMFDELSREWKQIRPRLGDQVWQAGCDVINAGKRLEKRGRGPMDSHSQRCEGYLLVLWLYKNSIQIRFQYLR